MIKNLQKWKYHKPICLTVSFKKYISKKWYWCKWTWETIQHHSHKSK